jgi:hypothetical protein
MECAGTIVSQPRETVGVICLLGASTCETAADPSLVHPS